MTDLIQLPSGIEVGTGLLVPETRPMTFASFPEVELLTKAQIEKLTSDLNYKMGRKRFGSEWIANQGRRGSCNGFAGAKALQRARVLRGESLVKLSGEGLYALCNGGRDQGSMLDDGMEAMVKTGVPLEELVAHEEYLKNRISKEAWDSASRFRALEPYRIDNEDQLATGLANGFVGVVAVHAGNAFMKLDTNGVAGGNSGPGNHAVGVDAVRVRNGKYEFDFFNSWGLSYCDQGRAWLTWERHFTQTIKYHAFYLIRSTIDDPQGDSPFKGN